MNLQPIQPLLYNENEPNVNFMGRKRHKSVGKNDEVIIHDK
jgi:hypothetical protein